MSTTPNATHQTTICDDCGEPSEYTICAVCEVWRDRKHDHEGDEPAAPFNLWSES